MVAYFAAARLGLSLAFVNSSVTAVWPPTGIALALALLLGGRVWVGIWLGAFAANYSVSHIGSTSALIAVGNLLEAVVGAALVNQFAGGRKVFDGAANIFRFVLYAAMLGAALASTIGTTVLCVWHVGDAGWLKYGAIWTTWWMGDAVSALILTPLIVIWTVKPWPRLSSFPEAAVLGVATTIAGLIAFGPTTPARMPAGYLTIPTLLWAAMRFLQRGVLTSWFVIASIAVWGTLNNHGVFASDDANRSLLFLQVYLGTVSLTFLVLSAVVAEQRDVEARQEESERRSREMATREQNARREAELANKAKDNFLAVLSHELRTPLTPVLLTASMLERHENLPAEVLEDLRAIRRNIELEARLIDDLLDLTRIARGKLQLNMETTDLHAVIHSAIGICCSDGKTPITEQLSADEHFVRGDSARLQQVFWNLMTNAQKFTPVHGSIRIRTSNPKPETITVEVIDSGIGIEPEVLPKLFNAFEQGDAVIARKAGGLGLGLAISKALVAAHGGNLVAYSAGRGLGATFAVQMATVPKPQNSTRIPAQGLETAKMRSLNVLLVEDDEPTKRAMSMLLRKMGHQFSAAGDIKSALGFAEQGRYDLVISDLGLPDGSGHELMREIKTKYGTSGIALSGFGMEEDIRKSHEAGFAEHLIKPITIEKLEAVIAKITG
jgi:signal transduction histidine kinase/CheY-like chemotaxis protein